ncbi:MAG: alpha/beta hydrolase [Bacteroidetes bacterium]|nr:alpha/beta hydrolase [Bacteroidota bacterium]
MKQILKYQNHQIFTSSEGKGDKIIFLHGWPTNSKLWQAQVNSLKNNYQVITLDWLGFGQSDKPVDHTYSFTGSKEILDLVLKAYLEEGEKITLVAHDIGGPPTILWASENQEKVKRLILLNTVLYPFKTTLDALSEVLMATPLLKDMFVSSFGLRMVMKTNTKSSGKEITQRIDDILSDYKEVASALKRKTIHEPLHNRKENELSFVSQKFKNLDVQKYLIIAKEDPLCYAHIKKLSEENPAVPVYYIPDCGHFMAIDRPEALNTVLGEILGE